MRDFSDDLKELRRRVEEAHRYLRIDDTQARLAELEREVQRPDLWDDQERAKQVNTAYARAREDVTAYADLASRLEDAEVLHELAREEGDDSRRTLQAKYGMRKLLVVMLEKPKDPAITVPADHH